MRKKVLFLGEYDAVAIYNPRRPYKKENVIKALKLYKRMRVVKNNKQLLQQPGYFLDDR